MHEDYAVAMLVCLMGFTCAVMAAEPTTLPAPKTTPVPIDVAHAPAPLFDDETWHGASDPYVIWNPVKGVWTMYYTQRRAALPGGNGVTWVHGSAIGIATSTDGTKWDYSGTCRGDHDLTEPLKADGAGPEPGITWWAPCFLYEAGTFHMFVTRVDGVYPDWKGKRHIVHFMSPDGFDWTYRATCNLASERVIDPTVYKVNDTWYMVYKNEAAGSNTFRSQSKDLVEWTDATQITKDGSMEAPYVFHWKNTWWMIVDAISKKGLRVYKSADGIDGWQYAGTVLGANDGTRPLDTGVGHHPGILLQGGSTGDEQCLIFYFTQRGRLTWIQLAELELTSDGTPTSNRNKYAAPSTQPATVPTDIPAR